MKPLLLDLPAHEWLERRWSRPCPSTASVFWMDSRHSAYERTIQMIWRTFWGRKTRQVRSDPAASCSKAPYGPDAKPNHKGPKTTLGDILVTPGRVDDAFILPPESLLREKGWIYLKGGKKEAGPFRDGFTYRYSEGPITFPDSGPAFSNHHRFMGPSRGFKHCRDLPYFSIIFDSADANEARKQLERTRIFRQ